MEQPDSEHEKERIDRLRRAMYSRVLSGKLKDRPRRQMDEIHPVVDEEWHHPEPGVAPSVVASPALRIVRRSLQWFLILAVVFFVGAVGFFGYYFTIGPGSISTSARNIEISISGPPQIAGGEPTQLQVVVTNRNQQALQLAELVISYPEGTRSPTDLSTDLSSQRISLGTIESGGRRQGTVSAVFSGVAGGVEVVVELEYRLPGSNALFVASSQYQTTLGSSPLAISIQGNTETVSGQAVEITAVVSSNANAPVRDVLLSATYPFGFTLSSASPQAARAQDGGHVWELGDIAPGQTREITLRGTLLGESGDERVFHFSAGTRKTPEEEAITTTLADSSFEMNISDVFLALDIAVNNAMDGDVVVTPDGKVNVTVQWENKLSTAIQDAVIIARLSGVLIDGSTVTSIDGFYRSSDNVVLWDKTTTNGLFSNISAGERGSVSFAFSVPPAEELASIRNPTITLTVNAAGKRISEEGVPENLQATDSRRIGITSSLTLSAQGLYYANPFGSTGPLPPKADTETTYAVVFTLTNTSNRIERAKLTATLPSYVRWVGIYSPGFEDVSFNQTDGTMTWDIGTIEPEVGLDGSQPRQAAIALGLTPSTSQIGQEPDLLQNITLTGIDTATDSNVSREIENVTTSIIGDPGFSAANATVVR